MQLKITVSFFLGNYYYIFVKITLIFPGLLEGGDNQFQFMNYPGITY